MFHLFYFSMKNCLILSDNNYVGLVQFFFVFQSEFINPKINFLNNLFQNTLVENQNSLLKSSCSPVQNYLEHCLTKIELPVVNLT